jgi:hypothetical protein
MKLLEFLRKVENVYNGNDYKDIKTIVDEYKMISAVRYDKKVLKELMADVKKFEKKVKIAINLKEEFSKYIDFRLFVLNFDSYRSGKFTFFKNSGFLIFNIDDTTLSEIKDILIKRGYTDEKSFKFIMRKNYLLVLNLFIKEFKEELKKRFNLLGKTFSKEEEQCILRILKGKECNKNRSINDKLNKNHFRIIVKIRNLREGEKNA